jgi:hypothetical protein
MGGQARAQHRTSTSTTKREKMTSALYPPTLFEIELAESAALNESHKHALAELLADHRERLLKPFEELRRDFEALGDEKVARYLDELLRAARGIA